MIKYVLKKDTPFYKKGTEFCEDWFHKGVLLNDDCSIAANLNELDNPDEWFEKVDESSDWLHDGASYYSPEVSGLAKKFVPSYNEYRGDDVHDEARRHIGICYKSREACQRFIDFLTAVEVVSHDDGFMTPFGKVDEVLYGFGIFCDWEGNLCAEEKKHMVLAGEFYFDNEENAEKSIDSHPDEWKTILNYDWSKE